MNLNTLLKNQDIYTKILFFLLLFFPITFFIGSALANVTCIILSIVFLLKTIAHKEILLIKNKYFIILFFFFISIVINLFFSINFYQSLPRSLGFFRFIPFVFILSYLVQKNINFEEKIFKFWLIIFLIITFDLLFEKIFGSNILGFSGKHARLAGFMGNDELKIGNYYFIFALFSLISIKKYYTKNIYINIFFIFLFLIVSFFIGERANFFKTFLVFSIFVLIVYKRNLLKISLVFLFMLTLLLVFLSNNRPYQARYWDHILKPIINKGLISYYKQTHYGAHSDAAIQIFKDNIFFGIGLRNFRYESGKEKYENLDYKLTHKRASTHPHQFHVEFLSETGIFGYLSWIFFMVYSFFFAFKHFLKKKNNYYLLASIIIFSVHFIPIIPTGSFFTTYGASLFWINYSIMICYSGTILNKKKINFS